MGFGLPYSSSIDLRKLVLRKGQPQLYPVEELAWRDQETALVRHEEVMDSGVGCALHNPRRCFYDVTLTLGAVSGSDAACMSSLVLGKVAFLEDTCASYQRVWLLHLKSSGEAGPQHWGLQRR